MAVQKVGRNDLCSCGSGKKFKKCCESKGERSTGAMWMGILIGAVVLAGLVAVATSFNSDHASSTVGGVWSEEHGHYH
jgi:hypothetical protein